MNPLAERACSSQVYAGMVERMDDAVGVVLGTLAALRHARNETLSYGAHLKTVMSAAMAPKSPWQTWEKHVLSARGFKRVGRHSEHAIKTVWRCVRRGPGVQEEAQGVQVSPLNPLAVFPEP